jgi:hypothetical protein
MLVHQKKKPTIVFLKLRIAIMTTKSVGVSWKNQSIPDWGGLLEQHLKYLEV